jgi:hypothetical protein
MKSGRLRSCGEHETRRGVPVSEIFDLDKYMMVPRSVDGNSSRQYPLLVSYDDYQKVLGNTTTTGMAKVCMRDRDSNLYIHGRCTNETSPITQMKQNNLQSMIGKSNQKHFVLHMEDYWKGSAYELGWQLGIHRPNDKLEQFRTTIIPFHPTHIKFVDDLLKRANITTNNFSAIHWRAEKEGMDYMRCARAVNEARHIMLREMITHASNNVKSQ